MTDSANETSNALQNSTRDITPPPHRPLLHQNGEYHGFSYYGKSISSVVKLHKPATKGYIKTQLDTLLARCVSQRTVLIPCKRSAKSPRLSLPRASLIAR